MKIADLKGGKTKFITPKSPKGKGKGRGKPTQAARVATLASGPSNVQTGDSALSTGAAKPRFLQPTAGREVGDGSRRKSARLENLTRPNYFDSLQDTGEDSGNADVEMEEAYMGDVEGDVDMADDADDADVEGDEEMGSSG